MKKSALEEDLQLTHTVEANNQYVVIKYERYLQIIGDRSNQILETSVTSAKLFQI